MSLYQLIKIKNKVSKRLGRGIGSGLGKTAGRGTKGQKSRGKIPLAFSGSGLPFYKKLPLRRGLGNPKVSEKVVVLNLGDLDKFRAKSIVDVEELLKHGLINKKNAKKGVKILGDGEIKVALTFKIPVSQKAKRKIEAKGGKVLYA